jgi:hypothetical protein
MPLVYDQWLFTSLKQQKEDRLLIAATGTLDSKHCKNYITYTVSCKELKKVVPDRRQSLSLISNIINARITCLSVV